MSDSPGFARFTFILLQQLSVWCYVFLIPLFIKILCISTSEQPKSSSNLSFKIDITDIKIKITITTFLIHKFFYIFFLYSLEIWQLYNEIYDLFI